MALPPGTSGWVGSGFDCTCKCSFEAGFVYNGNEPAYWGNDPPPVCLLMFAVGNLQNGCTVINVEDADITITLKRNGTTITDPFIYDSVFNAIYWQKWKPTAGDVYTADVTLVCGSETYTKSYSYTIPTPANTNCNCCTERTLDYIIVSGFTDEFAIMNGTYGVNPAGGSPNCCYSSAQPPAAPALPSNPCGNLTFSSPPVINIPSACLFTDPSPYGYDPSTGIGFYYYQGTGGIGNICFTTAGEAIFTITYSYKYSRRRPADATGLNPEGCIENGGGGSFGYSITAKAQCESGVVEITSNSFPGQSPTITAVFK